MTHQAATRHNLYNRKIQSLTFDFDNLPWWPQLQKGGSREVGWPYIYVYIYMWVGRIGSMCPSSFAPGFPMQKLWKSSQNHAKCNHRWVSCGLSCWGGAQSMRSLRVSKPKGPIILWGWVFIPTFPNELPWFGFCLMWKLELVWWVFGLVLWSWGFEPDSFLNESFWLSFCLVWKLELIWWVLGLVLWSWTFSTASFLNKLGLRPTFFS